MYKLFSILCEKIVEGLLSAHLFERISEAIKSEMNFALIEIKKVNIESDNILILRHKGHLSEQAIAYLIDTMRDVLPNNKCVVLEEGMDVNILSLSTEPAKTL